MTIVSVEQIASSMVFDLVPESERTAATFHSLGIMPPSQEVGEREKRAAHDRVQPLRPLVPVIQVYSAVASEVVTKAILERRPDDSVSSQELPLVMLGSTLSILGHLLDVGVLQLSNRTGVVSE